MRRAAKVDENQKAIVDALRDAGVSVLSLAAMAKGCPDLLAYRSKHGFVMLEVKNKAGRGVTFTLDQVKFHRQWPVTVVTTPEEALAAVGL